MELINLILKISELKCVFILFNKLIFVTLLSIISLNFIAKLNSFFHIILFEESTVMFTIQKLALDLLKFFKFLEFLSNWNFHNMILLFYLKKLKSYDDIFLKPTHFLKVENFIIQMLKQFVF